MAPRLRAGRGSPPGGKGGDGGRRGGSQRGLDETSSTWYSLEPDAGGSVDLLAPSGVAERAAELVSECVARAGGPPSLVLVADVSCAMALIQPLVATLAALGRLLPPGAVAIVAHERREAKVDAAFERALARAALTLEVLKVPAASTTDAGGETTANARLRLWKVPLN